MAELSKTTLMQSTKQFKSKKAENEQNEFEMKFFSDVLERYPDYVDVLRALGTLLTRHGQYPEGLAVDQRLVRLKPSDPIAHYNLACSYCLLRKLDLAFVALRKAFELGYQDFAFLRKDSDLEGIRHDKRFKQLMREFAGK